MIPFTQYLLPAGRAVETGIDCDPDVEARAQEIIAAGYRFEIEILTTGDISATIHNPNEGEDVAIRVFENARGVVRAEVSKLVMGFAYERPVRDER